MYARFGVFIGGCLITVGIILSIVAGVMNPCNFTEGICYPDYSPMALLMISLFAGIIIIIMSLHKLDRSNVHGQDAITAAPKYDFCPNCGFKMERDGDTCPNCATPLRVPVEFFNYCFNCGRKIQRDWVACPYCSILLKN